MCLESLGWARLREGEFSESLELNRAGTALARSVGDPFIEAQFAIARGVALANLGQDARPAFEEALRLSRQNRDQSHMGFALGNLGYLELLSGDPRSARIHIEDAIRIFREYDDTFEVASWSMNLGLVYCLQQDQAQARRLFVDAFNVISQGGNAELLAQALLGLALTTANADTAATLHGAADAVKRPEDPIGSMEMRLREADHARLRQALGERRFQRAYESGFQLSATDAIALAMEPT
jgi:tetratricopeptide (TPR) repeat protein